MDRSEMRLDPLTGSWTLFASGRAFPPDFNRREESAGASPFAPGNERFVSHVLHTAGPAESGWQVRVIANRTPILRIEGDATPRADGFYDRLDAVGAHEVVVEDPGGRGLEELPRPAIEQVISAWKLRMVDLLRDPRMRSFVILRNIGRPAGARLSHPVSQLVAMALVHPVLRRKLETSRAFFEAKKRSIFADILGEEVRAGSRLVYENNGFAVFCPYASRVPFELAIYPKRQCPDFHGLSDQEISQFADVLQTSLRKLNLALDQPAYHFTLLTAPARTPRRDHWNTLELDFRWHVEIVPRLHYSTGFGFATGCHVNGVWPETAAATLRSTEVAA